MCQFPQKWKSCFFWHPELGKHKVKKRDDPKNDCGKCEKNEKELTDLRNTGEHMKNALNTNTINNKVN